MDTACPFCEPDANRVIFRQPLLYALWDGYPVSPGHALLIPHRHVATWFDASRDEQTALMRALDDARHAVEERFADKPPDGFNIGINAGTAAGQTVMHLHIHLIPRWAGDVPNPRGGIRHVIPGRGLYDPHDTPTSPVTGSVETTPALLDRATPSTFASAPAPPSTPTHEPLDSIQFAEKIQTILAESKRTATYKYALLLALMDVCLEHTGAAGEPPKAITTDELARKVIELYWPHSRFFVPDQHYVLRQNTGGRQAEIISLLCRYRARHAPDPSAPLAFARAAAPAAFDRLVADVEFKLIEMPLPRLQLVGSGLDPFLYWLSWQDRPIAKKSDLDRDSSFDRNVYLQPGAGEKLVRLAGLIRPVIQREWARMVADLNDPITKDAQLDEFLFGLERTALDPIRPHLRDFHDNRCFYCDERIRGAAEVDHFVAWSRYPDDGIENLVLADPGCNAAKGAHLASAEHLTRWAERAARASELRALANAARWESHPERTWSVVRAIYLRLGRDARLWYRAGEFHLPDAAAIRIALAM